MGFTERSLPFSRELLEPLGHAVLPLIVGQRRGGTRSTPCEHSFMTSHGTARVASRAIEN